MKYSLEFPKLDTAPENKDGDHELDEYVAEVVTALAAMHTPSMAHGTIS